MAEKKRENKRKNEEKRDSTFEAALLQIALKIHQRFGIAALVFHLRERAHDHSSASG